ncbi:hypothetical protein tinsulaeT_29290 [Thalassotalea insulae]|uniref:Uncharacterized protein n=1 Tax=Thalassotalea insulae TaxID=2056778 RepID=A0ABQ6GV77_9GAMM|nr:hypothetical protein [Thalassotalea insulae]GLX79589.1 hypothetical protein tinsulaeT_29290 [Thalassotalea insulae]
MTNRQNIALGDSAANIRVFIANRPPLTPYQQLCHFRPIQHGEIKNIAEQTGNHWRKIFNVYAKFIFELKTPAFNSWQHYRDRQLLTKDSNTALIFSKPKLTTTNMKEPVINIVLGKTYATELGLAEQCQWISPDFAINHSLGLIISPYFDYRQLSNIKITQLCQLVKQLVQDNA